MFLRGVKVLFFRQIFGFKHRWKMSAASVLIPVLFVAFAQLNKLPRTDKLPDIKPGGLFRIFKFAAEILEPEPPGIPNLLTVIVRPDNSSSRSLMTNAQHVLQSQFSNTSGLDLRLRFAKSPEDMNQSLADSEGPSIGVEFHSVADHQLEYTLHPVLTSLTLNMSGNYGDDSFPHSLLLRAAIDAAYIQTHFPGQSYLRLGSLPDLLNFDNNQVDEETKKLILEAVRLVLMVFEQSLWALGILFLITFFASQTIRDKTNGVRELLCICGLPRWMVNTSWLIGFSLLATDIAIIEWIILEIPPSNPVIPGVSPPLMLVYLIVHNCTATFSVYLLANIFTSALLLVMVIVAYWITTTYSMMFLLRWGLENNLVAQAFVSLVPNVGTSMFWVAVFQYSEFWFDKDVTFKNVFSTPSKVMISPGLVLVMMLISILLFLILGLYFDAVKPGPYGRAKPWYLFTKKEKPTKDGWFEAETPSEALVHEHIEDGEPIGLECVNIVKIFGTHKALKRVNLRIMKNKITVLLGHNGAGKTTLFSILCGMFSPTSGDVFTEEYNVFKGGNIKRFRSILGYCPQESLLMQELTVHEHLIVFGLLKGLVMSEALEYSDKWTQMFDMGNMRSTQAKNLSGGSKRKLCLAIAMTGNPQYLLLDEPSAGMDIESTKKFASLLLEEKGNCTVVITTHNMDEAELLGEYIAILAHGELKCYGSTSFLKQMLDTGYRLNCSTISSKGIEDVITLVTKSMVGATVLFKTNRSVTFNLPVNKTKDIPNLLQKLESQYGKKISSTLSPSTLDDVFLKVQKDMGVTIAVGELPTIPEDEMWHSSCNVIDIFMKRVKWILTTRVVLMVFCVILLPILSMIASMAILVRPLVQYNSSQSSSNEPHKERQDMFALVSSQHDQITDLVRSALAKSGIVFKETSHDAITNMGNMTHMDLSDYPSNLLFSFHSDGSNPPTAYFPSRTDKFVSMAYTTVINALLQGNASVITHNAPFLKLQMFKEMNMLCPIEEELASAIAWVFNLIYTLALLVASSYFIIFPHLERTSLFKHLQLMTGLLPASYWLVNLLFDMLIYIGSIGLIMIPIACMDRYKVILEPKEILGAFILILILYGLCSILFSYVWSFFCRSASNAITSLIVMTVLLNILLSIISHKDVGWPDTFKYEYIYFLPWAVLRNSVHKLIIWALKNKNCLNCPLKDHGKSCDDTKKNPLLSNELEPEIITFAILSVLYFLVLMFFDHGLGRKLKGCISRACCGDIRTLDREVDPEVAKERMRVNDLVTKGKDRQVELIAVGLAKNYGCMKTAVYDVTFGAERGECFGLVGVNGSGKTTTFGMLAALMSPTKGTAIIEGTWKVTGCEYNYMKRVGYCPQHNALLGEFSGRAVIQLFGRLCGVPRSKNNHLVDQWINALDMAEIAKKPCGHYSGGNKRKLCLAIALIGNPPIALLDEPTAGVDPVVRRRIWEIISSTLQNNQTIILTSHTMSECEAICDRLTIMVKGVMMCLGPIPSLKHAYGKRSILEVKFTPNSTAKEQNVVKSKIESAFDGFISLEDRELTRLKYILNTENKKTYDLFASMLRIQSDYKVLDDFNLVEAPLEQVFMMFAKKKTSKKKLF